MFNRINEFLMIVGISTFSTALVSRAVTTECFITYHVTLRRDNETLYVGNLEISFMVFTLPQIV